jgi:hypothetical protein
VRENKTATQKGRKAESRKAELKKLKVFREEMKRNQNGKLL